MMNLNLTTATRIGLNCLALLGVAVALRLGESIFIPLTFALLLSAILWPVVEWLNRRRIPWSISCMIAVGLLLSLLITVTLGFSLAGLRMIQGLPNPNDPKAIQYPYHKFRVQVQRLSPVPVDSVLPEDPEASILLRSIRESLQSENLTRAVEQRGQYLGAWLLQLVLIMFVVLFLLMEGKFLTRRVVEIFGPSGEAQTRAMKVLAEISESVRTYLVWRTLVNVGLGLVLGGVYQALQLRQAWTWALLAMVLCYVPYIGTIIAGVPPVLDAFIFVDTGTALGIVIFYVAVVTIEGYVIVPVVMGRSMQLNATTVLLACLFWDLVWGTPGLFLAMPLMAALKAVCTSVPEWRPWANLMGTDDDPPILDSSPPQEAPSPEREKTILKELDAPAKNGPPSDRTTELTQ
jgi:predicted PurR-regulated permease PerM